jgi:O-antigen/teichoic acid export membrane protein
MTEGAQTIREPKPAVCSSERVILWGLAKRVGAWWNWRRVSPEKRRLLGDAVWVALGQVASAAGLLVGMRLLTEFVPPEIFGTVSLLIGVATLGSSLFCNPQLQAAVRFYPDLARQNQIGLLRTVVVRSLRRTCTLLAGLILVGGAIWSFCTGLSYGVFVALAALLVSGVFSTLETNLLGAARRQRAVASWNVAENIARPGLGILAVVAFGVTPTALLAGYAVATAGILLIFRAGSRRKRVGMDSESEHAPSALAEEIHRYAKPLIPMAIVSWVNALSDRYILGEWAGPEQVGIYAAAYGLISRPFLMAGGMLLLTLRPVYYEAIANGNKAVERRALRLWVGATVCTCAAGVLGIFYLRESIAEILLAPKYRSGAAIMPILAAGFSLMIVSHVFSAICYAHKKTNSVLWLESGAAAAMIVFGIPLIMLLGLRGAAIATTAAYAIQAGLAIYLSRRVAGEPSTVAPKET